MVMFDDYTSGRILYEIYHTYTPRLLPGNPSQEGILEGSCLSANCTAIGIEGIFVGSGGLINLK